MRGALSLIKVYVASVPLDTTLTNKKNASSSQQLVADSIQKQRNVHNVTPDSS